MNGQMNVFRTILISLFVFFVLAVLAVEIIYISERPRSEFANYIDAKASGLMDRGWIPTFIPRSSAEIKEQHDLDANWVKMSFSYDTADKAVTRAACNTERPIRGGVEFGCKYFGNNVSIKLYDDGSAELYSSPY